MQLQSLNPFKVRQSASPVVDGSEPIAAIQARYPDEWLAIEVTATNRKGDATRGKIIAHGNDKNTVVHAAQAVHPHFLIVTYTGEIPYVLLEA